MTERPEINLADHPPTPLFFQDQPAPTDSTEHPNATTPTTATNRAERRAAAKTARHNTKRLAA